MKPLRIALNHTRLASSGGVESYIYQLLGYLLERGHEVDFFAGRFLVEPRRPGLRLIRVPYLWTVRPLRLAAFAYFSRRAIRREEARRPYDVVQGFSKTYYQTLYRDGSGCRLAYREMYLDPIAHSRAQRLFYRFETTDWFIRRIERLRYAKYPPRLVIASSAFVRYQILERYALPPERVRVVYGGVDCDRFHPRRRPAGREKLAALFGSTGDGERAATLAFVSNDHRRKGLDLLLEALARRRREDGGGRPFRLLVAGTDPLTPAYEAKARALGIAEHVRFPGARADIPDLLAGSDLLLLPSHFDAFAHVVSEAFASGVPAIASSTSGAAELIADGVQGWVLRRNDVESLGRALDLFFACDDLEPLRRAARETALRLSWKRHFEEVEAIYAELAAQK
jgi:UDP-glucose:(heptosyl)LPS alpha-1,3-glucosyltransferase